MYIPKYLRSTHPDVIDTIEANVEGRAQAHRKACEFAARFGAENGSHYGGHDSFTGGYRLSAIDTKERPTQGRWKKGPHGLGFAPYANNPLRAEMEAIAYSPTHVPGVPHIVLGDGRIGGTAFFVQDGAAWARISFTDVTISSAADFDLESYGWEEVLGSSWHAAAESHNAAITAEASA